MTCYVNLINKRCLNSNVMDVKFISHNKMLSRYKLLWINNHFVTCLLFTTLHLITSSMRNSILIPGMRSGLDSRWRALPRHPPPVTSTSSKLTADLLLIWITVHREHCEPSQVLSFEIWPLRGPELFSIGEDLFSCSFFIELDSGLY